MSEYRPEAKGGSVQVLISPVQPVQDVSIGFWLSSFSDQQAARTLSFLGIIVSSVRCRQQGIFGHIGRSPGCDVDTTGPMLYMLDYEFFLGIIVSSVCCRQQVRNPPMLGCKALRLELAGRVSGRTGLGRRVNFMTLAGLSLARHVVLPDHGVGLDGQSCSCLIVGWPVGLSSPTLGLGHPSVMFLFDCSSETRMYCETDRLRWDKVPWLVRNDVHGLGRTDHDRDPYDLALLEVARNAPKTSQRYKRAVRVDGELVVATSQLYQLGESDGTSSEVDQLS
ncbi:hypothetical protein F2Q70_00002241 [Brassica cretica]|uniref:Uncharacterized protein n=1 Tax=Brassica cretica TaxID=69181 RepID=A0A8S9IVX7_BRACR|nr:hypothetical protein F2Q70_00002241 [Brassica cretica]